MGASCKDIALTIISGEQKAYYSSVKNAGNLLWDLRLGLFSDSAPLADRALQFIRRTDWRECTEKRRHPLPNPVYGSVTIDFDRKTVTDANGWGSSDRIQFAWLKQSISDALRGGCGLVPGPSLLDHFENRRIQLEAGVKPYGDRLLFSSLAEAHDALNAIEDIAWNEDRKSISFARIALPDGWRILGEHSER